MGMSGYLLRITAEQLQELIDAPFLIEDIIRVDDAEPSPEAIPIGGEDGKDWQLFHYLLTGKTGKEWNEALGPLGNAIFGGTPIGDDVGYGPADYLTPDEVRATSIALDRLPPAVFVSRYNANELALEEIYPGNWDDAEQVYLNYLAACYEKFRDYYREATRSGDAMLRWLE